MMITIGGSSCDSSFKCHLPESRSDTITPTHPNVNHDSELDLSYHRATDTFCLTSLMCLRSVDNFEEIHP